MTGPQRFINPRSPIVQMGPELGDEGEPRALRTPNTQPVFQVFADAELEVTPPPDKDA